MTTEILENKYTLLIDEYIETQGIRYSDIEDRAKDFMRYLTDDIHEINTFDEYVNSCLDWHNERMYRSIVNNPERFALDYLIELRHLKGELD